MNYSVHVAAQATREQVLTAVSRNSARECFEHTDCTQRGISYCFHIWNFESRKRTLGWVSYTDGEQIEMEWINQSNSGLIESFT